MRCGVGVFGWVCVVVCVVVTCCSVVMSELVVFVYGVWGVCDVGGACVVFFDDGGVGDGYGEWGVGDGDCVDCDRHGVRCGLDRVDRRQRERCIRGSACASGSGGRPSRFNSALRKPIAKAAL